MQTTTEDTTTVTPGLPTWRAGFALSRAILAEAEAFFASAGPLMDDWYFACDVADPTLLQLFPRGYGVDGPALMRALGGKWTIDGPDSGGMAMRTKRTFAGKEVPIVLHYVQLPDAKREALEAAEEFVEGFVDGAPDASATSKDANHVHRLIRAALGKED